MQLFRSGAAQAYAQSFDPWRPTGNFRNLKSDEAKELFSSIPFVNFKAELDMAKNALREYGGTVRQTSVNDTRLELEDKRNEANKAQNKRNALIKMLSGTSGAMNRSGGGTGTNNDELLQSLLSGNPLDSAISYGKKFQDLEGMVRTDSAEVTGGVAEALKYQVPERASEPVQIEAGQTSVEAPAVQPIRLLSADEGNKIDLERLTEAIRSVGAQTGAE